ncbi:hypothetical protein PTTG_09696 [Puccinia triticina 1-1 BBBD Race 1]|uniref:TPR_REGION domain-containing protein n=1 Tax=Puccinia triticina (isolate 1-1 / race 1 (BBBD)) TaxID=630390 RepID=A0A180G3N4_PUCT1|nr:hypothetical protein PTTG_09696 [Puccinia triticina 1-1 BBBD Race 1]
MATSTPPASRASLKQLLINKLNPHSSTLNITHSPATTRHSPAEADQQPAWAITDRLRLWRDDARAQHLYQTAAFWGSKVYNLTANPNDAFWLAQVFFLTGQFHRAEMVLTSAKRINPDTLQPASPAIGDEQQPGQEGDDEHEGEEEEEEEEDHEHEQFSFWDQLLPDDDDSQHTPDGHHHQQQQQQHTILVRMTDYSTACRYLAAQCMIRQGKWDAALDMVGDENPFRQPPQADELSTEPSKPSLDFPGQAASDGGIKFEASMCYLRGLIHLHHKALDRAKHAFLESLALDVKCYESFEALVGGNMLEPDEEWEFIQTLEYQAQTPDDALFIKALYTVRLKKFAHKHELFAALKLLKNQYGLSDDPDAAYGLADWLYTNYRFIDCYRITSRILKLHYHHLPTLPLHLTSMTMVPKLLPALFLLAHELIDREPASPVSWYAAGLWYFSQKRWEESRRFFSKAALLDARFPEAWFAFGHALAYEGEHDQAITAYSTAAHNFQGSHLPLLFIGMQHIQLANPSLANDYLSAAAEISPADPLVIHERGVVAYYQEQWQCAVDLFTHTLDLVQKAQTDPLIWASTYLNLAHCFRRLKRFEASFDAATKAKALLPRSAAVLSALGMACMGVGRPGDAIKHFHESLAVVPADPMTTSLLHLALDLQTVPAPSEEEGGGEGPVGPRALRQTWDDDFRLFDLRLDAQYGPAVSAERVLHLRPRAE